MTQVRIVVEYSASAPAPLMRWERVGQVPNFEKQTLAKPTAPAGETFELLGRAFEVAQREEGAPFRESLAAFFRGALVRKEDLADVLTLMNETP
jgi:hypothetical protein